MPASATARRARAPSWRSTRRPARSTWWSPASCWNRRARSVPALSRPTARCSSPHRRACSRWTRRRPWATAGSIRSACWAMAERFSRRAVIADFAGIAAQAEEPAQCRAAGRHRRHRRAADPGRGLPRRHPRRGQGGGCQSARLRGGVGAGVGSDPIAPSLGSILGARTREGSDPRQLTAFPAEAHAVLAEGIKRLTDYQDRAYAWRYLARVNRFVGSPGADGRVHRRARPPPRRAHERRGRDPRRPAQAAGGAARARRAGGEGAARATSST